MFQLFMDLAAAALLVDGAIDLIGHTPEAAQVRELAARRGARAPGDGPLHGVIHCFTASQAFAEQVLALGFYISISGIVTFKNARDLQETAATIPADRLLVETDAPFLAPIPHRGKTGEPAFVADTARYVAQLRGVDVETLAKQTSDNFYRLFSKAVR